MGEAEIEAYLTYLAQGCHVAGSTQNQALCALLFLYWEVLGQSLSDPIKPARTSKTKRLPTVLSRSEVQQIITHLRGTPKLVIQLLYCSGLRLMEGVTLRVQDLDFAHSQLIVRNAKGSKQRVTMLSQVVVDPLQEHLSRVKRLHGQDLAKGHGAVTLPYALARKYPQANREWVWQFVFPSAILSVDQQDGVIRRFHIGPSTIQRALKPAANKAQIEKRVTSHA
jgi:integron integrase